MSYTVLDTTNEQSMIKKSKMTLASRLKVGDGLLITVDRHEGDDGDGFTTDVHRISRIHRICDFIYFEFVGLNVYDSDGIQLHKDSYVIKHK